MEEFIKDLNWTVISLQATLRIEENKIRQINLTLKPQKSKQLIFLLLIHSFIVFYYKINLVLCMKFLDVIHKVMMIFAF